jgi:hypothetical protein
MAATLWSTATIIERGKYTARFRESVNYAAVTAAPSLDTSACTDTLRNCRKDKESKKERKRVRMDLETNFNTCEFHRVQAYPAGAHVPGNVIKRRRLMLVVK